MELLILCGMAFGYGLHLLSEMMELQERRRENATPEATKVPLIKLLAIGASAVLLAAHSGEIVIRTLTH